MLGHSSRTEPNPSRRSCKSPVNEHQSVSVLGQVTFSAHVDWGRVEYRRERLCMTMPVVAWRKCALERATAMSRLNQAGLSRSVLQRRTRSRGCITKTIIRKTHVSPVVVLGLLLVSIGCSYYARHWSTKSQSVLSGDDVHWWHTNRSLLDNSWVDEIDSRLHKELFILSLVVDNERKGRDDSGLKSTEKVSARGRLISNYRSRGVEEVGGNSKLLLQTPLDS